VGPSVEVAVYRAVYTEINARLQTQALALGGTVTYLEPEEGAKADLIQQQVVMRPWELWKAKAMAGK
jgi:ribulose-5-phosphate 4-epimerase/fuculose-1-phosphate aldolase